MSESKAKELIKKRVSVKAKITQFSSYLNVVRSSAQLSELQITELTVRLSKIENFYSIYDTLQSDLEMIADDPDELYAEREQFESQYYNVTAAAQLLVEKHRASKPIQPEASSLDARTSVTNAQNYVRLPKIDLPHFCGDYHKWLEFRDTFNSLIHSNKDIDNINKFHYLRSSLQGSAALVIKNLDFTGDNYTGAWELLYERYNNNRLLINNHVQDLFNLPVIHRESSRALRELIDTTNKNLRALSTLNQKTEHWDILIIHMMSPNWITSQKRMGRTQKYTFHRTNTT
ncbi:hypothetical protein EVAR_10250_1 [Eumeta japonica]|uniref:Uncharacterized protein n=1 Tax=Eumeta variegata TaxID=151549 RepID=A0A4C1TGN8_EUMVA|nr:hypothetical protein EVAR_10250_1 [Eumeta japonica]